jgi:hypothetical protein
MEYECQPGALLTASDSSLIHTVDVLFVQSIREATHLDPLLNGLFTLPRCSAQKMKATTMKTNLISQIGCDPEVVGEIFSTTRMTMTT